MLPTLRRAALGVLLLQAGAWLLIGVFGFATSLPSNVLALTQMPGVLVLSEVGWCCGLGGGFVLSDVILSRYGGLTLAGAPVLAVTNTAVLLAVAIPVAAAWAHVRARGGAG